MSNANPFDFGELFAITARAAATLASKKRLSPHFDIEPSRSTVHGDPQAFHRSLYRFMASATELLDEGDLVIVGIVQDTGDGQVKIRLSAAASGREMPPPDRERVMERLSIEPVATPGDEPGAVHARGRCPILGADISLRYHPSAGALLEYELACRGDATDLLSPHAHGARAMIVQSDVVPAQGLAVRLERLGWDTSVHLSVTDAAQALRGDGAPVALLLAVESPGVTIADATMLSAHLDGGAETIFCAMPGSPSLVDDAAGPPRLMVWPLMPSELWDMTNRLGPMSEADAEISRPMPLARRERLLVLVVDDDEVNRVIATGLLNLLGYDTRCAEDGEQAIGSCHQEAPDAVLMDVHMPKMNGHEAARTLKHQQRIGTIPSFPIVAATAAGTEVTSLANGMDGHIAKPLLLEDVRRQLTRLLRGHATVRP